MYGRLITVIGYDSELFEIRLSDDGILSMVSRDGRVTKLTDLNDYIPKHDMYSLIGSLMFTSGDIVLNEERRQTLINAGFDVTDEDVTLSDVFNRRDAELAEAYDRVINSDSYSRESK